MWIAQSKALRASRPQSFALRNPPMARWPDPMEARGDRQIQDSKFKRRAPAMPINHEEIIEDIEGHIRKFGGGFGEWCVGTAKDSRGPFFRRHLAADLGDGLIYREAYTTSAAEQVIEHLVNARGLALDRDAVPESGKIVFVYRKTADVPAALSTNQATFRNVAA
jgi:hypothetical protein